jgi:hypothetical protein
LSSLAIALVVFLFCFAAAIVGMVLNFRLPDHHLDGDSKDVVKLVMGLVATMAALVLGLLIASAKNSYDTQMTEMQEISTNLVQLDQMLVRYGAETKELRADLKTAVIAAHEQIWPPDSRKRASLDPSAGWHQGDALFAKLQNLIPKTDGQRSAQSAALQLGSGLSRIRVLMFEQVGTSISLPLLTVLLFWISALFLGFGLLARFNLTVAVALIVGALSVSSAIFLMLELSRPYEGLMRISDVSIRSALDHIDQ